MAKLYFITHPEVIIDPETAISEWQLSETGRARVEVLAQEPWAKTIKVIYSSAELKAYQSAEIFAQQLGLEVKVQSKLGEIDRSIKGYLSEKEFNQTVKEFFKRPQKSINDWEKARDAQKRIAKVIDAIIANHPQENVAVFSHGGVGALLVAYLKKLAIHQRYEQPQLGCYFVIDTQDMRIDQEWTPIDEDTSRSSLGVIDRRIKPDDKPL